MGIIVKVRIVKKRHFSSVNGEFYYIVAYIAYDLAPGKSHQADKRWELLLNRPMDIEIIEYAFTVLNFGKCVLYNFRLSNREQETLRLAQGGMVIAPE